VVIPGQGPATFGQALDVAFAKEISGGLEGVSGEGDVNLSIDIRLAAALLSLLGWSTTYNSVPIAVVRMEHQTPDRVLHKEPKKNEVFGVVAIDIICGERQMSSLKLLEACLTYYHISFNLRVLTSILSPMRKVDTGAYGLTFAFPYQLVGWILYRNRRIQLTLKYRGFSKCKASHIF